MMWRIWIIVTILALIVRIWVWLIWKLLLSWWHVFDICVSVSKCICIWIVNLWCIISHNIYLSWGSFLLILVLAFMVNIILILISIIFFWAIVITTGRFLLISSSSDMFWNHSYLPLLICFIFTLYVYFWNCQVFITLAVFANQKAHKWKNAEKQYYSSNYRPKLWFLIVLWIFIISINIIVEIVAISIIICHHVVSWVVSYCPVKTDGSVISI